MNKFIKKIGREVNRIAEHTQLIGQTKENVKSTTTIGGNITKVTRSEPLSIVHTIQMNDQTLQRYPAMTHLPIGAGHLVQTHQYRNNNNEATHVAIAIRRISEIQFRMSVIQKIVVVEVAQPKLKIVKNVSKYSEAAFGIGMRQTHEQVSYEKRQLSQIERQNINAQLMMQEGRSIQEIAIQSL